MSDTINFISKHTTLLLSGTSAIITALAFGGFVEFYTRPMCDPIGGGLRVSCEMGAVGVAVGAAAGLSCLIWKATGNSLSKDHRSERVLAQHAHIRELTSDAGKQVSPKK